MALLRVYTNKFFGTVPRLPMARLPPGGLKALLVCSMSDGSLIIHAIRQLQITFITKIISGPLHMSAVTGMARLAG